MSDFLEHVKLLRDNLDNFVDHCAQDIGRGCMLGTGILPVRVYYGVAYRPRLVVISSLPRAMQGDDPDSGGERNSFGTAFMRDEPLASDLIRLIMIHTDNIDNFSPKVGPPDPTDKVTLIMRLSHAISIAEPTTPTPSGAKFLYSKVIDRILAAGLGD